MKLDTKFPPFPGRLLLLLLLLSHLHSHLMRAHAGILIGAEAINAVTSLSLRRHPTVPLRLLSFCKAN